MRVSLLAGSVLALAVALAGPASAQPSPEVQEAGIEERAVPIGLVLNPTAYSIPEGRWLLGVGTFQQAVITGTADRQYSIGVFNGITDRFYAGAFWTGVQRDRDDGDDVIESFWGAAAHYQFLKEGDVFSWSPSLAVGGYAYIGQGNGQTAYVVASRNLMGSVRPGAVFLHTGWRYDRADNDDGVDDSSVRHFVGANLLLTTNISLNGEYRQRHFGEEHNPWAAGAIIGLGRGYAISAGVQDPGSGRTHIYAGVNIIP